MNPHSRIDRTTFILESATVARRAGGTVRSGLLRCESGQAFVELAFVIPLVLLLVCGIIEVGRIIETTQILSSLSREGANLASRGATMEEALNVTRSNQLASGLGTEGGAIVSELLVEDGVPRVSAQIASVGLGLGSRVALLDSVANAYTGAGLSDGNRYYVVEMFVPHEPITPLRVIIDNLVPETLYDRSLF